MPNLTIRMEQSEKRQLAAWAASRGKSVTEYLKDLVAEDMAAASPESRAKAWLEEHRDAIAEEARALKRSGIPGAELALDYPRFDDAV